jgi:hypothetical protein
LLGLAVFSIAPGVSDLFSSDSDSRFDRHHCAGLSSRAGRRRDRGLMLGETLSSTAWVGLGCVVIGVAAMTIPARKIVAVPEVA